MDGAPSHRSGAWKESHLKRVQLPKYSPELNPAERVFQEKRRQVEGWVYLSLEGKKEATEVYLRELADDPDRVKRLVGWDWFWEALQQLPPPKTRAARSH